MTNTKTMTDIEDKAYCDIVEKCRRQRSKVRTLIVHIDTQRELIFKQNLCSAG